MKLKAERADSDASTLRMVGPPHGGAGVASSWVASWIANSKKHYNQFAYRFLTCR